MVDKHEQIISLGKTKSSLHGQIRSVISHDVMFKGEGHSRNDVFFEIINKKKKNRT